MVQISEIIYSMLCLMEHKIIGVHELLIYDTVFVFIFLSAQDLKKQ